MKHTINPEVHIAKARLISSCVYQGIMNNYGRKTVEKEEFRFEQQKSGMEVIVSIDTFEGEKVQRFKGVIQIITDKDFLVIKHYGPDGKYGEATFPIGKVLYYHRKSSLIKKDDNDKYVNLLEERDEFKRDLGVLGKRIDTLSDFISKNFEYEVGEHTITAAIRLLKETVKSRDCYMDQLHALQSSLKENCKVVEPNPLNITTAGGPRLEGEANFVKPKKETEQDKRDRLHIPSTPGDHTS